MRAVNSAGTAGSWSSIRRFTPRAATTPPAPAALSALSLNPASVTGGSSSQGTVTLTSAVTTSTPVTITASAGTVTRTATLTVNPPGQNATLTVTATGRGGERVTSSPAGINVVVGSTGSAPFAVGTRVTLSATNSRDVIWSGACSSGGNKQKSCAFTLNGTASVTANVQ